MIKMNEENRLIIKQLNKFGRIPETSELLKMIEDLEKERTMYKTSFEEMSKNYFELQNNWNELKTIINKKIKENREDMLITQSVSINSIISSENNGLRYALDKMQEMESK